VLQRRSASNALEALRVATCAMSESSIRRTVEHPCGHPYSPDKIARQRPRTCRDVDPQSQDSSRTQPYAACEQGPLQEVGEGAAKVLFQTAECVP